jgi:hypothetical protein
MKAYLMPVSHAPLTAVTDAALGGENKTLK